MAIRSSSPASCVRRPRNARARLPRAAWSVPRPARPGRSALRRPATPTVRARRTGGPPGDRGWRRRPRDRWCRVQPPARRRLLAGSGVRREEHPMRVRVPRGRQSSPAYGRAWGSPGNRRRRLSDQRTSRRRRDGCAPRPRQRRNRTRRPAGLAALRCFVSMAEVAPHGEIACARPASGGVNQQVPARPAQPKRMDLQSPGE